MKKAFVLMTGLFVLAAINVWATPAVKVHSITVDGATNDAVSITVSAGITVPSWAGMATFQATSANGLSRRYFQPSEITTYPPTFAQNGSWSNSDWNPYFTGDFIVDVTAWDVSPTVPPGTASVTVTVARAVSGTVNSIKYSSAPYNATGDWTDVDSDMVKLHDIGLSTNPDVVNLGCNLLNANVTYDPTWTPEQQDLAFTDTVGYKPAGTPYRFNVSLHARPQGFMGMGEIKRWIWTPADTNVLDGPGCLEVDITSCSPWRSDYSNAIQSHVGFAPLYADAADMPEGLIQCTTAHYMDVGPTNTESGRIGLYVKGHTGTNSYLKMFLSDTFLQGQIPGLTNVYDATNILAGFVQHFDTNNVAEDSPVETVATFTRIPGGTGANMLYDYDGNGVGESGFELRFDFTFQSGVAAMVGIATPAVSLADFAMVDNNTGVWHLWFSGSGYQPLDPVPLNVSGTPVAADFDGDGHADFAMVDNNTGVWHLWFSGSGYQPLDPVPLNVSGTPVAADFDGDGHADFAMVSSAGVWRIWFSGLGYQMLDPIPLNVSGTPVAADFDGDGLADFAMVDSASGVWRIWFSGLHYQMLDPIPLNVSGTPVAADIDGR